MMFGYLRGSLHDQTLDLQRKALNDAGCAEIYEDRVSGTRAERPGLKSLLAVLREGDTLMVWRLDRLGCRTKELCVTLHLLEQRGIHFRSLTDQIDTDRPDGRFFFHLMRRLWLMERDLTAERTRAGQITARRQGRPVGRKPRMTEKKIEKGKQLLAGGLSPKEVAKKLQVSVPTLYRWLPATVRLSELKEIESVPTLGEALDGPDELREGADPFRENPRSLPGPRPRAAHRRRQ